MGMRKSWSRIFLLGTTNEEILKEGKNVGFLDQGKNLPRDQPKNKKSPNLVKKGSTAPLHQNIQSNKEKTEF